MSVFSQLWLLLCKNFILRKRQPVTFFVEFVWPIALLLIIVFIKRASPPTDRGPCYYQPLELPNGDFLSFMKSFVCMLDYRCHKESRIKNKIIFENQLNPLYEIVSSGDKSYVQVSSLLENLKNALYDVNDIRNEPIIMKIQNGSISMTDFLNDTKSFKVAFSKYGVNNQVSSALLASQIQIIEIYKMLDVSSKFKEKYLCNPLESYTYFKASPYFYNGTLNSISPKMTNSISENFSDLIEQSFAQYRSLAKNYTDTQMLLTIYNKLNNQEKANWNLADILCRIPKKQLITDADFLSKEISSNSFINYTNTIVEYFSSPEFSKRIVYLTNYFSAGQKFGDDLRLLQKFSSIDEIIDIGQSGLKLISLVSQAENQFLFAEELLDDFSSLFGTLKEFQDLETLVSIVNGVNRLMRRFDLLFTMENLYGTTIIEFYEKNLRSDAYSQRYDLLQKKINFQRSLEFLFKLQTGDVRDAICVSPKITRIFNSDLEPYIQTNLNYYLDKYCLTNPVISKSVGDNILAKLNFGQIIKILRIGISSSMMDEITEVTQKLSTYKFAQFNIGSTTDLIAGFKTVGATLEFLQLSLVDTTKLNLKNFYVLTKSLLKIFLPDLLTNSQWLYADIFLPIFLPTLDLTTNGQPVSAARTFIDIFNNTTNNNNQTSTTPALDYKNIELFSDNQILFNETNSTFSIRVKRSADRTTTKNPSPIVGLTTKISQLLKEISLANNANRSGRVEFDLSKYPGLSSLLGSSVGSGGSNIEPNLIASLLRTPAMVTALKTTKPNILGASGSSSSIDLNPFSLFDLITSINSGNALTSTTGLLQMITPLFALLPLDQMFPGNTREQNLAIVSTLPEIIKIIQFFNTFQDLSIANKDPYVQLAQWKRFIADLKSQGISLIKVLQAAGAINNVDYAIVEAVLSTNIETISDPDVIGKVVLGCQGLNLWGVIKPDQPDLDLAMSSMQLILEITELALNATLNLVDDSSLNVFKCSNNPLDDYYKLTKNLNVFSFAAQMKKLILNDRTAESKKRPPSINCLKIDQIYKYAMRIEKAFKNDVNGIIANKLDCFRTSIFLPYSNVLDSFKTLFSEAESNAVTITILTSKMNKFVDLINLIKWLNGVFEPGVGKTSLLNDPAQANLLLSRLPEITTDLEELGKSLEGLGSMQKELNVNDLNNLKTGGNMFELLNRLKSYDKVITKANTAINKFWAKYISLISSTSYSEVLFNIYKGIEALNELVSFVINNINGVKIKDMFSDYPIISSYFQSAYSITAMDADQIGESYLFTNPQKLFDIYIKSKEIYCDPVTLKKYIKVDSSAYIKVADEGIKDFWPITSKFLCNSNTQLFGDLTATLASSFVLPEGVKDIFENDQSIFQSLRSNSTIFTNLNASTFKVTDAKIMDKLDGMFKLFAGINSEYSGYSLPNILGKSLCGADFLLDFSKYGYTLESSKTLNPITDANKTARMSDAKYPKPKANCPALFNEIRKIGGSVIGNLITPLIFGKIVYTPKNNATEKLIQQFNQTFQQFDQLNQVLTSFSNGIDQFDELKRLTANLSVLLDNPFYQDFIQLFLLQDSTLTFSDIRMFLSTLENVTSLSNNWSYISDMVNSLKNAVSCFETNRFIAVDSEKALVNTATELFKNATFLIGFVFENTKPTDKVLPENFSVKIRMNLNNVPETNLPRGWLWIPGPADNLFMDLRYMRGFAQIQNLLERAIVTTINSEKAKQRPGMDPASYDDKKFPVVYLQQFPYPKYRSEDVTSSYINYFILPIIVTLMWSGNIGLAIRNLIKEKEKFIEETMKAMGLRPGINFLAWFITTYINMLFISLLVACILKYGGIFPVSDLSLIFLSLGAFAFSAIMLAFCVGSFFTKTNLASLIGILAYFMSYLPFILVMSMKYELGFDSKVAMCMSSATCFGYSSLYMSWYEQQGRGMQWSNFWISPIPNDRMTYGLTIILMITDGIMYGLFGWYIKNVIPSKYGAAKPVYFLFTPKYWRSTFIGSMCCSKAISFSNEYLKDSTLRKNKKSVKSKEKYIETEPANLNTGISIQSMSKKFKERTVVNNLTLNFFEGQITALLGHNGAGKSTTINVLTGIYAPSSGTAFINDKDVRYDYNQIKKNVGICPQHDILFDYMTVKEHLEFYGKLKGNMGRKELKRDIADMMTKVGLNQYSNDYVSALSGGLRRRLEVAIAFVCGSKTVILDEPTSGVDPYNRMKIWDIILEFRKSRTILLTTHYLEEADVLSDRIAIIHQGHLQCCGSSLFLKNKFGSGYILTVDKKIHSPSQNSVQQTKKEIMEARNKSIENILHFIQKRITDATLTRQINNTLNFTLPYSNKTNFESFFIALEKNKSALDIASYGISDTTLEEIFLMLTTRDEHGDLVTPVTQTKVETISMTPNLSASFDSDKDSGVAVELSGDLTKNSSKSQSYFKRIFSSSSGLNTSMESMSQAQLTQYEKPILYSKRKGRQLYTQQFIALILKRFHHNRRNLRVLLTNILLPVLFVVLSMAFTLIKPKLTDQVSLELTPSMYNPSSYFMTFQNTNNNTVLEYGANNLISSFTKACQLTKTCPIANTNPECPLVYQLAYQDQLTPALLSSSLQITPTLQNCSIEAYLMDTHTANIDKRFGGLTYADNIISNDQFPNQSKVIVWFENQAYHSMPAFLHQFYAQYTKCIQTTSSGNCQLVSDTPIKPLYRIYNHPISLSDERISVDTIIQKISDIGISLTILCAYAFVPAGFAMYIVRERITQEKRLQYVCGVKPFVYWFASFFWDILYFSLIILITLAFVFMFGQTAYTASVRNFTALTLLLFMFGFSSLPMTYLFSRFFKDTGSAYMIIFCFTLFSGVATCVAVFLLSFIVEQKPDLKMLHEFLEVFSMIFPSYCLGSGLIEITKNQIMTDTYAMFGINNLYKDPFSMEMLGKKYLALTLMGIVSFIIIAIMETKIDFFPCCKPTIEPSNDEKVEDIDVNRERERVQNNEARSDVLVIKNLTKRYRKATGSKICAVNNVCFSIPWGHCFGLLGINGAGKTTTFKMITDEIQPTFGSRLFSNMKLKEFLHDNIVGYCPQFDAVDEYLTGKEALYIYSKLIGLNEINAAIVSVIIKFKLQSFVDVPIIKYSGGMKRTLSVAVAMLGDPQVVLLDEPTNGMDPEMRRRVWDNILGLIKEDRSVLLTSHSMAECDVLCSRLAIMVNGQFTCLGTTQHLKHRFGGGYTLQIKVSKDSAINTVCEFVESKFLNCLLKDKHGNKLEYIIPHRGNSLGKIFGVMELNKLNYFIADYSVSQTTLDQVFINFAKSQRGKDSEDEFEDDEEEYNENDQADTVDKASDLGVETRVNMPEEGRPPHVENSTLESIKNHFNSLKKSRHIRKTSSAKSVNHHQSLRSRKSSQRSRTGSRHRPSISDGGFTNLAYEVEYRNSDAGDLAIREAYANIDCTLNEADEFSRC